jgi:DNA repair protein RecO (recombination protein O)
LTTQVAKQDFDEVLYELYISALEKINSKLDPLIITNIVELKYLSYLGISLNLDGCVNCGSTKDIITLDGDVGGFVCKNCYTNEKIVSSKAIKLIRMYNYVDIKNISNIDIEDNSKYEINYFLNRYYERYTGLYLKSKKFLDELNKI